MIVGHGIDLCDINRIEKIVTSPSAQTFLNNVFSEYEQLEALGCGNHPSFYAKRFAAKEAFAKALGTGITTDVKPSDIIIKNGKNGNPTIVARNGSLEALQKLIPFNKICNIHLSLSKQTDMAIASVIIESV
jgi:holo-[acyl-carrier protein] synthase